jgi:uncharacterized protein YkwD
MPLSAKTRPGIQHKKRQAQHHRRSKGYMQTYWPYIPMLLIVGLGFLGSSLISHQSAVLGNQSNFSENRLLSLTNQARSSNKIDSLSLNSQLEQAAQAKASSLVSANYWSHTSPSGETPADLLASTGYKFGASGENIAYGFSSAQAVMTAWLNSPEHRANVLGKSYSQIGFGVSESSNFMGKGPKVIIVAEYAKPLLASALTNNNVPTAVLPANQSVSRFQIITKSNISDEILTIVITFGLAYIVLRHGIFLKRITQKGELYAVSHPLIDIAIVAAVMFCAVYSRSAGIIG